MNPLTNVKNITKLNERELALGVAGKSSWHNMYKDSAWIFIGGLPFGITEGDVLCVFSQYGEIANLNLVRDKKTGKTKGFCFLCYVDQKSTILAVDNLNAIKLCGRTIRVDHVANYKPPKENDDDDELTKALHAEGCAPKPPKMPINEEVVVTKHKKVKKEKKKKKKKRKHRSSSSGSVSRSEEETSPKKVKVKKEKIDPEYERYEISSKDVTHAHRQEKTVFDSESSDDSNENQMKFPGCSRNSTSFRNPHSNNESNSYHRNNLKQYDKESNYAESYNSSQKYSNNLCHSREESTSKFSKEYDRGSKSRHHDKVEAKISSRKDYEKKDSRKYESHSSSKQYSKKSSRSRDKS